MNDYTTSDGIVIEMTSAKETVNMAAEQKTRLEEYEDRIAALTKKIKKGDK